MAKKEESQPAEKSTLFELAKRNGQLFVPSAKFAPNASEDSPFRATHQVADVYHGWSMHEKTLHQPVMLSDADYLSALEAAKKGKTHKAANHRTPEQEALKQANRAAAKGN